MIFFAIHVLSNTAKYTGHMALLMLNYVLLAEHRCQQTGKSGRVFLLTYNTFHVFIKCTQNIPGHMVLFDAMIFFATFYIYIFLIFLFNTVL